MLQAAFGKFNYTPPLGGRLGRLAIHILSAKGTQWPLYLRAALFDDGSKRTAVIVLDQGLISSDVVAMLREAMHRGSQTPAEHCMISVNHTHNGPALMPWLDTDTGFEHAEKIAECLETLGKEMASRLAPARLMVAQTEAPGWSWNRRPIFRDELNREFVGTYGGREDENFQGMEGEDESALRILLALREDGSSMGGLVNFWCHPTTMYREAVWSADFPGPMLEELESHFGGDFVFLNGPSGDLSNYGGVGDEGARFGPEYCRQMGKSLAKSAIAAQKTAKPVVDQTLRCESEVLTLAQRMVSSDQVQIARDYLENHRREKLSPSLMQQLYGWEFHFHQNPTAVDEWLAIEVLGMREWQKRVSAKVLYEPVEVQLISIGNWALASVPCELFSALGHKIINSSPIENTWVVALANGYSGYIPTPEAFAHGGYECSFGFQCRLEPQAGPKMVAAALRLLSSKD